MSAVGNEEKLRDTVQNMYDLVRGASGFHFSALFLSVSLSFSSPFPPYVFLCKSLMCVSED
jgi:hypothetical protein